LPDSWHGRPCKVVFLLSSLIVQNLVELTLVQ